MTGGKEEGEGGKKEKGRMELNIGVESGRSREYIFRLRTFCKKALDDHYSLGKTPVMGASGLLRLTSSPEELLPCLTLVARWQVSLLVLIVVLAGPGRAPPARLRWADE
eukprot:6212050-Pleurochrysis_carterae.AAC.4